MKDKKETKREIKRGRGYKSPSPTKVIRTFESLIPLIRLLEINYLKKIKA